MLLIYVVMIYILKNFYSSFDSQSFYFIEDIFNIYLNNKLFLNINITKL